VNSKSRNGGVAKKYNKNPFTWRRIMQTCSAWGLKIIITGNQDNQRKQRWQVKALSNHG
jgi:hypothetical protein